MATKKEPFGGKKAKPFGKKDDTDKLGGTGKTRVPGVRGTKGTPAKKTSKAK